ncbi:MAG: glycine cleavage system protein GcvH [Spirochaetales bacterium]|uniref:Glycine cleavage system H protein n=1 Tax=Candidatus Thalassospirochaeta sargassi TaxID=3119039 RepID=A0AAJ1MKT6_9SPIO|nr:glycine cleavage system protein GcvH [Spirochaetales bacterium]
MDAEKLLYSKDHEWVSIDGETAVIGITDYAQEELGDIVFVELPESGSEIKAGEAPVTLESVKAVSSVYCPFSGIITEINSKLEDEPEIINSSPLDQGWIFKIKITSGNKDNLLNSADYEAYIKELD